MTLSRGGGSSYPIDVNEMCPCAYSINKNRSVNLYSMGRRWTRWTRTSPSTRGLGQWGHGLGGLELRALVILTQRDTDGKFHSISFNLRDHKIPSIDLRGLPTYLPWNGRNPESKSVLIFVIESSVA